MPLTVPRIDDRGYDALLREALARIPVHTPEWTNHNDSDPGVTLLQLFAFMTESLLYRSNLVPERNRVKFLQLLGITPRPASAARGVVTISNERGPMQVVTLGAGVPIQAGRTGFVTTNGLDVLPVEARVYYRRRLSPSEVQDAAAAYAQLYGSFTDDPSMLEFYETQPFAAPAAAASMPSLDLGGTQTVDRTAWIALLARPGDAKRLDQVREEIAGKTVTIGIMPLLSESERVLHPGNRAGAAAPIALELSLSSDRLENDAPVYQRLEPRFEGNPLEELTLAQVTLPAAHQIAWWNDLDPTEEGAGDLPPALDDEKLRERLLAWVRMRVPAPRDGIASSSGARARFSWIGINAAKVSQRVDVIAEPAGVGSGEPGQAMRLVYTPVIPDSVRVIVGGETYDRIDDLFAAAAEVQVRDPAAAPGAGPAQAGDPRVFAVDGEGGTLTFGNGLRGKRPPRGAQIFVSYAYGGGSAGNVGIGELKLGPSLPAGFRVANPLPTWGGTDAESVADAEQSIPRVLRHANRAASEDDFREIVRATPGVEVERVDVLPLYHPVVGAPSPGVVTVVVLPRDASTDAPMPDSLFLRAICAHLQPRRLLTTEVHVRGPEYVGLAVSVGIDVIPGRDVAVVREDVRRAIRQFVSPRTGGVDETGWPLDKDVEDRELLVRAARVPGVAKVRDVRMWNAAGTATTTLPIAGLQLPRLDRVGVSLGDAEDLSTSTTPTGPGTTAKRLPVPVVPREC